MVLSIKRLVGKIDIKVVIRTYLILYCLIMILYCSIRGPLAWGEYDDYTLPVASIFNDHNFSITDDDLAYYKVLFPEQTGIDDYSLSGYTTRDGSGQLTWYFPTFAILSIPLVLILKLMGLPASYGFMYTNIALVMILLLLAYKCLDLSYKRRFAIILMLSINPILFYFPWMLAEVMIFSFLGMAILAWYNGWYKRAAVFLSIAGTLNATVMVAGFLIILDYLVRLFLKKKKGENVFLFIKKNIIKIITFGSCFIIGLIPMIYNYYNIGHINLTASYSSFTQGRESTLQRFRAYFLDLNYGYLPYYGVILFVALLLFVVAIKKKHWRYIGMTIAFVANVYLYSIMVHINCGGSGIARYSSWCGVILVLAVILFYDELLSKQVLRKMSEALIGINVFLLVIVIYTFGPYAASNTWGTGLRPVAKFVLDYCPALYNPLGSTFYASINNLIGGYDYVTPVVYTDDNGYVRKILATSDDAEVLARTYAVSVGDEQWFYKQLDKLTATESYISVPTKYKIVKNISYYEGFDICFKADGYNAGEYVNSGIYDPESWGSWSNNKLILSMSFSDVEAEKLYGHIVCGVYNDEQQVQIYVNDELVYDENVIGNDGIDFSFNNPHGLCEIRIELPNAEEVAPGDGRVLGLSIGRITFEGN